MFPKSLERFLLKVQKPGRYTGGELNSVIKDPKNADMRFAFCFPDVYEIGMSHLGMKILYSLLNSREDTRCERVFAPWTDMEEVMRREDIPLYGLESGEPIKDFDFIGFTLQYELCYTNVLNMLDLAGLPVKAGQRTGLTPIVMGGGPCACNPEPLAEFFDLFVLGEGEEVNVQLLELLKTHKKMNSSKKEFLLAACKIPGVYVPSLYRAEYHQDGRLSAIKAAEGAPETVKKRTISDLDTVFAPEKFVVPFLEIVHDRAVAELFRGCIRGCRFCQAGFIYRPIRERSPEVVNSQCKALCENTGYDEVSLCSLSTSDYTRLEELLPALLDWTVKDGINVALPSLRLDNFSKELGEQLLAVRRSGLTFAPEAGTQRLRDVINKNITEEEILSGAREAFRGGWTAVKLYFMLGLPTETSEDVEGIARLAQKIVDEFYSNPEKPRGKGVNVSLSASGFVPKPFTPFQWEAQNTPEEFKEKQIYLKEKITTRKVSPSFHNPHMSFLEGVFARGDRRLSAVVETAWRDGCTFDSWDDRFKYDIWREAFKKCGLAPEFYSSRVRDVSELLPWDHLDYGITKAFLKREREKAHRGETTAHCRENCAGCGAEKLNGGYCHARG